MTNISPNDEKYSEKCQNCIYKHKYVIPQEENEMLRMLPYWNGKNIASIENYLQDIENQHAHN